VTAILASVDDPRVDEAVENLLDTMASGVSGVELWGLQFDLGLAWPSFKPDHGGLGVSQSVANAVASLLKERGVPSSPAGFVGLHQVSKLLHDVGRPEQRRQHLRRIFTGDEQWCQLFSEPGAGSDLANVGTRARRDGEDWSIAGQKVWTSNARHADLGLLLARTDPDAPKHRGMTMFIVDMREPGVEIRPLRQADGGARFSEVFLEDVSVADSQRLGEPGDGWRLAMSVLSTERTGASDVFLRPTSELVDLFNAREYRNGELREEVVRRWIDGRLIALNAERLRASRDAEDARRLASISKVQASEHSQRLASTLATLSGPALLVSADYQDAFEEDTRPGASAVKNFAALPASRFLVRSLAMSIEGGTNQIARNIIGERVLGLPPDIRVDKTASWRETARA